MQNKTKKALIIGCGIGGPTLALFLKRAGIESEIYEARETPEGYSLSLSCNGMSVLQELGLADATFAAGSPVTRWSMFNGKGKHLGSGVLSGNGLKSVFIKRVPLGEIISDEARRQGIKIVYGKKVQNIETTSQGSVIATFYDGTSASGDLLIGCDGIHSSIRQVIDPHYPGATYTGLMNSGGYTASVKVSMKPETINFIFCKRAFFGYHVDPGGYIYWFGNWLLQQEPARGAFNGMTDQERRRDLLNLYRDDQPLIREMIEKADEIFPYFPSYVLTTQPTSWHNGRIALLGDAAHGISPSSGQGASMALEDAEVLAICLRDIPDLEQAFATYELLRRDRTRKMFDVGERGDSGKYVLEPMKQWFRDLTTPIFLKLFANPRASDWMYSYRIAWDTKISASTSTVSLGQETAISANAMK